MRKIIIEKQEDRLVLKTPELDSYLYLNYENKMADTSRLDENSCRKTFDCTPSELRKFLEDEGY